MLERFDMVVLGGGPAGTQAAQHAAQRGRRVLLVDRHAEVGGECVHHGTIPSKTLRESAVYLAGLRQRSPELLRDDIGPGMLVRALMRRLDGVHRAYSHTRTVDLSRCGVEHQQGRARFLAPHELEIRLIDGARRVVHTDFVVIATGSRPRQPTEIPIDHERVLDSDSILRLIYLPRSLCVLGAGVIACEFASVFQALGVEVTLVDKGDRPLGFLDRELTDVFMHAFERDGGRFVGGKKPIGVGFDDPSRVTVRLEDGCEVAAEKVLVALGRTATLAGLDLARAGLVTTERGFLAVDRDGRTNAPHVFAAGDVVGPPALAAWSMEQGRRAALAAFDLDVPSGRSAIPIGIYTVPEIASIGLDEAAARERHGAVVVGRASFAELARGRINGTTDGLLKLVAAGDGRLLGAQVAGEGATELIHLAQVALMGGLGLDAFVDNVFNFPTLAEAYRVAAIDAFTCIASDGIRTSRAA
jgi:NAD(P) transhydrogenase